MTENTDIVTWLRSILHNDRSVELHCQEAANEIERLREEQEDTHALIERTGAILTATANALHGGYAPPDCLHSWHDLPELVEQLRKERDEARLQTGRILNEIDCRIEHGADSNGHLEGIRSLFKDSKKSQDALDRLAELDQELGLI